MSQTNMLRKHIKQLSAKTSWLSFLPQSVNLGRAGAAGAEEGAFCFREGRYTAPWEAGV